MCSVCQCPLPIQNGHVTRKARAMHFHGAKHQSNVRRAKQCKQLLYFVFEPRKVDDALLLSIVATRIRTAHGSLQEARVEWRAESASLLRAIDNPDVESAILDATYTAISNSKIRSIARDSHALHELLKLYVK